MAERHVFHFLRGSEIRTHQATNLFSPWIVSNWRIELEIFAVVGDIKFPADPGDGVALAQKKSVAEFRARIGGRYSIHKAQDSLSAAIRDFKKDRVISFVHVLGFQEIKVGGKFDFALRVARRFVEIDDQLVVQVVRIHSEINAADDFLIRSGQSERAAILNVSAGNNFDASDMRIRAGGE